MARDAGLSRGVIIRPETPADAEAIFGLIAAAFGQRAEADLVARLRTGGAMAIALVAEAEGAVVGHIALSEMRSPDRALGLAPLAVDPALAGRGIGSSLVREALKRARAEGWNGVFVLGDPAYYGRFGFSADAAAGFDSPYAGPYLQVLRLSDRFPRKAAGQPAAYAAAFDALG